MNKKTEVQNRIVSLANYNNPIDYSTESFGKWHIKEDKTYKNNPHNKVKRKVLNYKTTGYRS